MRVTLYAPAGYWKLTGDERNRICNGCGAKGSFLAKMLPQGVFKAACDIHDYMYYIGRHQDDKRAADRVFINNLNRIVEAMPGYKRPFAKALARVYYEAVSKFGYEAFWADKVYPGMTGREVEL